VQILTHYELGGANPGGPPDVYTFAVPRTLDMMTEDIVKLRPLCDVLTVSFHKGILGNPEMLAMYDKQVSHAGDRTPGRTWYRGAHAHMLKGIEIYKGKAIYHGLGQFVFGGSRSDRRAA